MIQALISDRRWNIGTWPDFQNKEFVLCGDNPHETNYLQRSRICCDVME